MLRAHFCGLAFVLDFGAMAKFLRLLVGSDSGFYKTWNKWTMR
jgi:hypothetical protein